MFITDFTTGICTASTLDHIKVTSDFILKFSVGGIIFSMGGGDKFSGTGCRPLWGRGVMGGDKFRRRAAREFETYLLVQSLFYMVN